MPTFHDRFAAFLDEYVALHPTVATDIGDHRYDDRWPDVTEAGRQARLAFVDRWLAELGALPTGELAPDDAIDRDLLVMELEAERFGETELRDETWDPLTWIYLMGDGIFTLVARDFALAGIVNGDHRIIQRSRDRDSRERGTDRSEDDPFRRIARDDHTADKHVFPGLDVAAGGYI